MKTNVKQVADRMEDVLASVQWEAILKSTSSRMRPGDMTSFALKEELDHEDLSLVLNYQLGESGLFLSTYNGKIVSHESHQSDLHDKIESIIERTFNAEGKYVFSFREAINLLEGRSVLKSYVSIDGVEKNGWFKAVKSAESKDFQFFFSGGQAILPAYDLDMVLQKLLMRTENTERREELIKSLQSGDQQEIRLKDKAEGDAYFIQAEPASKSISLFDSAKKPITIQQLEVDGTLVNSHRNKSKGLSPGW